MPLFDVMATIHTGNWQVNVLAWYSLGKPSKILLFVGEGMQANLCVQFFQRKGCRQVEVCQTVLRLQQSPREHQQTIQDFIVKKVSATETCVLFRSAAKHLMREGMWLAYQALGGQQVWMGRLASAVLEDRLFLEQTGQADCWPPVAAADLELEDYIKIPGYHLNAWVKIPQDNNKDLPAEWQSAYNMLAQEADLASWWNSCRDLAHGCESLKVWDGKNNGSLIPVKMDNWDMLQIFFPQPLQQQPGNLTGNSLPHHKPWESYRYWIGLLWENVFARIWLLKQLGNILQPDKYKLYSSAKIALVPNGQELTDLDYVILFPNGRLLIFECKADMDAAQKPQQAEVRNRLADRLTGQPIKTCFLLPANDFNEQQRIEVEMERVYPKQLNFATVAANLADITQPHQGFKNLLDSVIV